MQMIISKSILNLNHPLDSSQTLNEAVKQFFQFPIEHYISGKTFTELSTLQNQCSVWLGLVLKKTHDTILD